MAPPKPTALLAAVLGAVWAAAPAAAWDDSALADVADVAEEDAPLPEPRVERGTLSDDDTRYDDGSPYDTYTFQASAGDHVTVELSSEAFDTLVAVLGGGFEAPFNNDDADSTTTNSRLTFTIPADGEYTVRAGGYEDDPRGAYTLRITFAQPPPAPEGEPFHFEGELSDEDLRLDDDSPFDYYNFRVAEGDRVIIDMGSGAFDTYLRVEGEGLVHNGIHNDDINDADSNSRVEFTAPADGVYYVSTTCYDPASRGAYTLSILGADSASRGTFSLSGAPLEGVTPDGEPVIVEGELTDDSVRLRDASPFDAYTFHADAGDTIVAELASDDIDVYLILASELMESAIESDDVAEDLPNSRIEFLVEEPGDYTLTATCFDPDARGLYTLLVELIAGEEPAE